MKGFVKVVHNHQQSELIDRRLFISHTYLRKNTLSAMMNFKFMTSKYRPLPKNEISNSYRISPNKQKYTGHRYQDISEPGHLDTEHMRHLGTR